MPQFRKKPVVIEAQQVPSAKDQDADIVAYVDRCAELAEWCGGVSYMMHTGHEPGYYHPNDSGEDHILIPTLEGDMKALPGDWIIQGVANEFYPCKPDIFEKTYEAVTD